MRFIQLTDLHIPPAGEKPNSIDIRSNFLKILNRVKELQPEFLVVTGDLCYKDGQDAIYEWIKMQLDKTTIPYTVIPGNHDDSTMLAQHFNLNAALKNGALYFSKDANRLFVDTSTKMLSKEQLNWLAGQLEQNSGPILLFIHHPVLEAGTPFMDVTHALTNKEEVAQLLLNYKDNVYVFSGHFHIDKTIIRNNIIQHITPSSYLQISQWVNEFKVDHHRPGFREIVLKEDILMSTVVYV